MLQRPVGKLVLSGFMGEFNSVRKCAKQWLGCCKQESTCSECKHEAVQEEEKEEGEEEEKRLKWRRGHDGDAKSQETCLEELQLFI